jgi:hypothetical protein
MAEIQTNGRGCGRAAEIVTGGARREIPGGFREGDAGNVTVT